MGAEASLSWWYRVLRGALAEKLPDLTTRQLAMLLHVGLTGGPHTVRGLSEVLAFSKPAVTRALDRLAALGWLQRTRDIRDRRSVLVTITDPGRDFLQDLARLVGEASS